MGTIGPTTNHSTGRDDHPLAFEVTSAERSRLGRPSSFLNGKERKQALNLRRCSPSEAASEPPPYLSFQLRIIILTFALSYILTFAIPSRPASAPRSASGPIETLVAQPLVPTTVLALPLCLSFFAPFIDAGSRPPKLNL